jgi:hypothetical protein
MADTTIEVDHDASTISWTAGGKTCVWPLLVADEVINALRACARGMGPQPRFGVIPGPKGKVVFAPSPFRVHFRNVKGADGEDDAATLYDTPDGSCEMTNEAALALADAFENAIKTSSVKLKEYNYVLSHARFYEVLHGARADGTDGPPPSIHADADTAAKLRTAKTFLDVVRDPDIVIISHNRRSNQVTIQISEELRGQEGTLAWADKGVNEPQQLVRKVRKALGKIPFQIAA